MKMKKTFLGIMMCLTLGFAAKAQTLIDNYGFTTRVDSTAWIDITGVDSTIIAPSSTITFYVTSRIEMGFTFMLGATACTRFSANINGAVGLGNVIVYSGGGYSPLPLGNNYGSSSQLPKVEPFGWRGQMDSSCYTRYAVVGDSGSHVLVVETRMGVYGQDSTHVSFQVQLHEAGNELRIVYGPTDGPLPSNTTQTGLMRNASDRIFIDIATNSVYRSATDITLTSAAGLWPELWRCWSLTPDSMACPFPGAVTALYAHPDSTVLAWSPVEGAAGYRLTIPAVGIDTTLTDTLFTVVGLLSGATTYTATLQTLCGGGRNSYRSRESSFTTAAGTVRLPWMTDFNDATSSGNWNCSIAGSSIARWERKTNNPGPRMYTGYIDNESYDATAWLVSPPIVMPAAGGVSLLWDYRSAMTNVQYYGTPTIDVMLSVCDSSDAIDTSAAAWDVLMTMEGLVSNYRTFCLTMEGYEGHRVRVAFVRRGRCFGTGSIDNVRVGTADTLVRIYAPLHPMVGEETELRALCVGSTPSVPFVWHSTLSDAGRATLLDEDSSIASIVYFAPGIDTLMVEHGGVSDTVVLLVKDCATVSNYPWTEDFENGYDCWTIEGSSGWLIRKYQSCSYEGICYMHSSLASASSRNRMVSPTFVMPSGSDIANFALTFQVRAIYNNTITHLSVYFVPDSTDGGPELLVKDTIVGWNTYQECIIPLDTFAGRTGRLAFENWSSGSSTMLLYLDLVELRYVDTTPVPQPTCDTIRLFPWHADFAEGFDCWYTSIYSYPSSSAWRVSDSSALMGDPWGYDDPAGALVTPPITLPADSMLSLQWTARGYSFYRVKISPTADISASSFTQLMLDTANSNTVTRHLDLGAYVGQTVRIGIFKEHTTDIFNSYLYIDSLAILPLYAPKVRISGPKHVLADSIGALMTATLTQGLYNSLYYHWSSAMVDRGQAVYDVAGGATVRFTYFVGGTDTITVVATNDYSSDTAQYILGVGDCGMVSAYDYTDGFATKLDCWYQPSDCSWKSDFRGSTYSSFSNKHIHNMMMSQGVSIPWGADDSLVLEWHVNSRGTSITHNYMLLATTGNYTDPSTYDTLLVDTVNLTGEITRRVGLGRYADSVVHFILLHDPITLTDFGADVRRLVIRDLRVRDLREPVVRVEAPAVAHTGESTLAMARLDEGSSVGLTYSWHSAMATAGLATVTVVDDSLHITYSADGTDTITVIVAGAYGRDTATATLTVQSCASIDSLPWNPNVYYGDIPCWRVFNFTPSGSSNWSYNTYGGIRSYHPAANEEANSWLVTPSIDLPTVLDGSLLRWTLRAKRQTLNNVIYSPYLEVLLTTGNATDTSTYSHVLFSDYLFTWYDDDNPRTYEVSLDSFAGQTVHIAFVHRLSQGNYISLDAVNIIAGAAPSITITPPTDLNIGDTCLFSAHRSSGSPSIFTYTWHSTMAAAGLATMTAAADIMHIVYLSEGTDTVTVVASNPFGSDTAWTVVTVTDCSGMTVPFFEDFNGIAATSNYVPGVLPSCWNAVWNGDAIAHAPHVIAPNGYPFMSNVPDNALFMVTADPQDYNFGDDTVAEVLLPRMADSLHTLSLVFDYRFERANMGILEVGYYNGADFIALKVMPPYDSIYRRDTVHFAGATVPDARMVLRWTQGIVGYAVLIDNVQVLHMGTLALVPQVAVSGPTTVDAFDTVSFTAILLQGDTTGLSYTWHSSLLDSTFMSADETLTLHYDTVGTDTLTVIAANISCADTAMIVVNVQRPATWTHTVTVTSADSTMGTVTGGGVHMDSTWVTIAATPAVAPDPAMRILFDHWDDGDTANPRQIFVVSDTVFTAYFRVEEDSVGIASLVTYHSSLSIYPNPAYSNVTVSVSEPSILTVIDMTGRVIVPTTSISSSLIIQRSSLPAGTYFIRVTTNRSTAVKKLVLQ